MNFKALLRVLSIYFLLANSTVFGQSITITNPNGGEVLYSCDVYTIKWTTVGSLSNYYNIDYSLNGGSTWASIATNYLSTNKEFTWTVPNAQSSACLVRVSDAQNGTIVDQSNANFTIHIPITVTSPNGGEVLQGGNMHTITWNAQGTSNSYDIFYSTNGGTTWTTIVSNYSTLSGFYDWLVPNIPSTQVLVRVRDRVQTCRTDQSNNVFTIIADTPELTSPNGGETWYPGCSNTITWNAATFYSTVRLEYSVNNGSTWNTIIASTANNGSYSWIIPQNVSSTCLVRASNTSDVAINDISDAVFTIPAPIQIQTLNGGETVTACENKVITWRKPNNCIARFNVQYSIDNGATWVLIASPNNSGSGTTQSQTWTVPNDITTSQALIRVVDYNTATVFDVSDANFNIQPNNDITVVTPNGGQSLFGCHMYSIIWNRPPDCISRFQLSYSTDNGATWGNIASPSNSGVGTSQVYDWTIPNTISSTNVLIRVADYNNATSFDVSDAVLSISANVDIVITSPNGGETLQALTPHTITWTNLSGVSGLYDIYYSTNGGTAWTLLTNGVTGNAYIWNVPNIPSTNCLVRVRDAQATCKSDVSNATFTIQAATPLLLTPNGGETLNAGCAVNITWDQTRLHTTARLDYSPDGGTTWYNIATNADNIGTYSWTPPHVYSSNYLIKISNSTNLVTIDVSNATFSVVNPIEVIALNGGETANACETRTITWRKPGSCIARFSIHYSIDNGATWTLITSPTNVGSVNLQDYTWNVPANITSSQALIRVSDYAVPGVLDVSNANFTIAPNNDITVTSPNGGETINGLTQHTITWTNLPAVSGLYNVQYSTTGGASWTTIATSVSGNAYIWTVPNTSATTCLVRVQDNLNTCKNDVSNAVFTILPATPLLLTPNGGEVLNAGCATNITWDASRFYSAVRIDYSTNGGTTWNNIIPTTSNTGTYSWTPLHLYSANYLIKVANTVDLLTTDASDAVFSVVNPIEVMTLNGGETATACETRAITWRKPGSCIARFNIHYSIDNGATWVLIDSPNNIGAAATTQSYTWTVPNNISTTQALIRVSDYTITTVLDVSNANFNIQPNDDIMVVTPNGGQTLYGCHAYTITWNRPACIARFRISYSTDGVTWNSIATPTNDGIGTSQSYNWTIPNTISSSTVLIRVADYNYAASYDESDAVFTISPNVDITVTSPNGGENIYALTQHTITWNNLSGVSGLYDLYYSTNGGTSWTTIASSVTGNAYIWNVPNVPSTTCLVRVFDNQSSCKFDVSNTVFSILPPMPLLLSPNGGEVLNSGCPRNITWDQTRIYSTVRLDYSSNGGTTWTNIVTNATNNGSYSWTPPYIYGANYLIKIANTSDVLSADTSDASFSVLNPIGVVAMNGGETVLGCSQQTITWTKPGTCVARFRVQYSIDNGATWVNIDTPTNVGSTNTQSTTWSVPGSVTTNQALIRVSDYNNATIYDESNANFTIAPNNDITVTSPNGGETINGLTQHTITWTNLPGASGLYNIQYSTGSGWTTIASLVTGNAYIWDVPNSPSTNYVVRVLDANTPCKLDVSDAVFTILPATPLLLTPNGGEVLNAGCVTTITWDATRFYAPVRIDYSTNGGTTWSNITSTTSNTGTYSWIPPYVYSTNCIVKISNTSDLLSTDVSNAAFTIINPIRVTTPNGGEALTACENRTITWVKPGNCIIRFNIHYSIDNGASWVLIDSPVNSGVTATSQSYTWTVPNDISTTQALIRVSDYNVPGVLDVSDANFSIQPNNDITVTSPNGGETLFGCHVHNITWNRPANCIARFRISYSTDGGTTWTSIANPYNTYTGTSQTYGWTVPNLPSSSSMLLRVADYNNAISFDDSDAAFTVSPNADITVTSPNGGQTLVGLTQHTITWTNLSGVSGLYEIHYSTNGGAGWTSIATSVAGNAYVWNVPNIPSTNCLVRVRDQSAPCKLDVSDAVFTIAPATPIVLTPNGGESIYALTNYNITWNAATYYSTTVRIDYSTNNGFTWNNIVTGTNNTGTYTWAVPNTPSNQCLVRVSNTDNVMVYDVSNAVFEIKPVVRILTPNGNDGITQWGGCTQTSITFDHSPAYSTWRIYYSLNGGSTWTTIVSSWTQTANPATYNWTIPNTSSNQVLVKVEPVSQSQYADQSDAVFTVTQPVTILQPNFGGIMQAGSTYTIEWASDGISNLYDILFSSDGGATWSTVVMGYNTSTNTYTWTVPNSISSNCLIKVRDNIDNCKEDISNVPFTITSTTPPLTVLTPTGGESLNGCGNYTITWTEASPAGVYDLFYSTDLGNTWNTIVTNHTTGASSYNWSVPNINSSTVLVKVRASSTIIEDISDALFEIDGSTLTITTPATTVCSGSTIQLNAVGGGGTYSWSPATGLSDPLIANPIATITDTVVYTVTSTNGACTLQDQVTIAVNENGLIPVSVGVVASSTAICAGSPVTFTATPVNGGSNPGYQWLLNGSYVGTSQPTFTSSTLNDNDQVSVVLTSSESCVTTPPVTSNIITMDVTPLVTPSVTLASSQSVICSGESVTFTATTVNGGSTPNYQWLLNGVTVGSNQPTYTNATLNNNDQVSVVLTSSETCVSGNPANSNTISITVSSSTTPTVSVVASESAICSGESVTFTATSTIGGPSPVYEWLLNGSTVGTNAPTYTSATLSNNDVVSVEMTSNSACAVVAEVISNDITMQVSSIPVIAGTINGDAVICEGATETFSITPAAGATNYIWTLPTDWIGSSSTENISVTIGTLSGTVSVVAENGCGASTPQTLNVTVNDLPVVTANATQTTVCAGQPVTFTGSGANSYTWDNGVTNNVAFNPSQTATYQVTGVDANGCSASNTVSVNVNSLPTVVATASDTDVCVGEQVTLSGNGANSYSWNNSIVNNMAFTPSGTQTYTVTGTDLNGCSNAAQVAVTVHTLPTVFAGNDQAVCQNTSVTLTASGATSYSWNNGISNGVSFPAMTTTSYTVTGTDANGCSNTDVVEVTVNNNPTVLISSTATAVCVGGQVTLTASGATSYSWSHGITNGVAFAPSSTQTYTVTGTDAGGCINTASITVAVNNAPTVSATATATTVCAGTQVTLSGNGATSYSWNNGVLNGVAFAPASTQTYTVTGTDANGCTNTAQVTVAVESAPTVTIVGGGTICSGSSANLQASGASLYQWNNGAGNTAAVTVSPTASTIYTVTGTSLNGCVSSANVLVDVQNGSPLNVSGDLSICVGEQTTISVTGANTYAWSHGLGTGASVTVNPVVTTTYTVTGTNTQGCPTIQQVTVNVNTLPTVQIAGATSVCSGESVVLTASGGVGYVWGNGLGNASTITVSPTTATTYTVTGTNASGCSTSAQTTVSVNTAPVVTATGSGTICEGSSITLQAAGASLYQWNNGAGNTASVTVSPASSTLYTVTGTGLNGCTATANVSVTVQNGPALTVNGDTEICIGEQTTISVSGANSYAWNNGLGTSNSITVSPVVTTTYSVTGTNTQGCLTTEQITVTVNSLPVVQITGTTPICSGESVVLTASGAIGYVWGNGLGNNSTITVAPTAVTNYTVTGTNAGGCSSTAQYSVNVNNVVVPTITRNDNVLQTGTYQTYQWYVNNSIIIGATSQTWTFTENGNYYVVVTDGNGCTATSDLFHVGDVSVENLAANEIMVYPNPSRGQFVVDFGTLTGSKEIQLYDVTGKLVFNMKSTENKESLDLTLAPGYYQVVVITDDAVLQLNEKVIIQQ
jgi:hypothetical protein